ncbi:MAG: shikimate dehydrogenase [Victivallaceae bacterium]
MELEPIRRCRYLVIGDPIAHSRSPQMQNAGLRALGIAEEYGKLHVKPAELTEFVAYARRHLWGVNLTIPHKEPVIPLIDSISAQAKLAGSVNTLIIRDGRIAGDSTDGYGLEGAVREAFGYGPEKLAAFFVGTGGAARAAAFHFAARGASALYFANRTVERAETLAAAVKAAFPAVEVGVAALNDRARFREFTAASRVVVQGTSCGLKDDDPAPFDFTWLDGLEPLDCFDTIYRPTPFLAEARRRHWRAADGRWMLLHQGARSLELWTGRAAPVEAMRRALEQSL